MYLKIRQARKCKGWTVEELSVLSGISSRSINWYEKQKRMPTLKTVEKLAKTLGVSPAWLVSWKD